ncbi:hypothetical protein [Brevundimonas sp. Root1279]|uniref:hypothetical protein n=1 Tax=Brevundimonas sp. Root1279 TaxID=1736443 RepID=UPI0006F3EA22|nr:hypothetical protein [Brevundimonas sp. Root1279]KQW81822.1 hypothetical protein ASC65_11070 [Brevundimonas sp. Root1279]
MTREETALAYVNGTDDKKGLERLIQNAKRLGYPKVEEAAFRRLISLHPECEPGSIDHDFWSMVQAFEYVLTEERGKTTRLGRTRPKALKDGVVATLAGWATSNQVTEGFQMLQDREMLDLSGEAIVIRHPDEFAPEVVEAAKRRLESVGYLVN